MAVLVTEEIESNTGVKTAYIFVIKEEKTKKSSNARPIMKNVENNFQQ
jgi:hypothetical protein